MIYAFKHILIIHMSGFHYNIFIHVYYVFYHVSTLIPLVAFLYTLKSPPSYQPVPLMFSSFFLSFFLCFFFFLCEPVSLIDNLYQHGRGLFQEHEQLHSCQTTGEKVVSSFQQEFVIYSHLQVLREGWGLVKGGMDTCSTRTYCWLPDLLFSSSPCLLG